MFTPLPDVSAYSIRIPQDYPTLQDAIRNVPDNSVIYMNTIDTVRSPILIHNKKNITIIGGGVRTTYIYDYPSIIEVYDSSVTFVNFNIYMSARPSRFPPPFQISGLHIIKSSVDIFGITIRLEVLPYFPQPSSVGIRVATSNLNIHRADIEADRGLRINDVEFISRVPVQGPVNVNIMNIRINASIVGIESYFALTNNSVHIRDYVIRVGWYAGVTLTTGPALDPRDKPYPGYNKFFLEDGSLIGSPPTSLQGVSGYISRSTRVYITNLYLEGFREGMTFQLGSRTRGFVLSGYDIDITLNGTEIFVLNKGIRFIERYPVGNNNTFRIKNSFVKGIFDKGTNALEFLFNTGGTLIGSLYRNINDLYIDVYNVEVEGFSTGIYMELYYIGKKRIYIEGYRNNDRGAIGANIQMIESLGDMSPRNPFQISSISSLRSQEDFYFANSILWSFQFSYKPVRYGTLSESIVIFESVYDEYSSITRGFATYSIWTLETRVLSKSLKAPLRGISVTYDVSPYDFASGATDFLGSFKYRFVYRYTDTLKFINYIYVEASGSLPKASTWYIPYINDTYTMPSWYGVITLYLDVLAFKAIGFSHKTGTTLLFINGYYGYLYAFYSLSPNEIESPHNVNYENPQINNALNSYPIIVDTVSKGSGYVVLYTKIFFEGDWRQWILLINFKSGIVYSIGPIDLRAVIIKV